MNNLIAAAKDLLDGKTMDEDTFAECLQFFAQDATNEELRQLASWINTCAPEEDEQHE